MHRIARASCHICILAFKNLFLARFYHYRQVIEKVLVDIRD